MRLRILSLMVLLLALAQPELAAAADGPPALGNVEKRCKLRKFSARDVVSLIYENVVRATPESLDEMLTHIAPDVVFQDPVMELHGREAFRAAFAQFITTDEITYRITGWSCSGRTVLMSWVFGLKGKATAGEAIEIIGSSQADVGPDDRITREIDSWANVPQVFVPLLRK